MHIGRHHRCRGIRAHATGVGAQIIIKQALVILTCRKRQYVFAIHHHNETGFLALKELLNHHACAALVVRHSKGVVQQHEIDGFMRFRQRHRYHHAFASGQAIGLDHNRRTYLVHIGMGCRGVRKGLERSRWNTVALHEGF